MKPLQAVRDILKKQNITINTLSKRANLEYGVVSQRMKREHISCNRLLELLRPLDYKLVIVPADRKLKEDEYEVE